MTDESHNRESARIVHEFDDSTSPSTAVIQAVSTLRGTTPFELDPLFETIDPVVLDETVSGWDGTPGQHSLQFVYEGCQVEITPEAAAVQRIRE